MPGAFGLSNKQNTAQKKTKKKLDNVPEVIVSLFAKSKALLKPRWVMGGG
jgi:hypothetical protein